MNSSRANVGRGEQLIDAMDKPLLALAVLTMVLYLVDLIGGLGQGAVRWLWNSVSLAIDMIFLFDLVVKLRVFGRSYIQTPWFLIDLISCLPLLDAIANGLRPIRAVRFVRGFRILRILRGLRILRALRSIPAFEQFIKDVPATQKEKALHRYMNAGLLSLTIAVLLLIVVIRKTMEDDFVRRIDTALHDGISAPMLRLLGGSLTRPGDDATYITRQVQVQDRERTVYFNMQRVENNSDAVEFTLILGMMISMLFVMYIIAYHQLDITQTQLRGLLNLSLPKQVAESFLVDPGAYTRKSRMPATILFMDFVGFTRACEELAHDPDRLSAHLEAAMDRLVGELVKYDLIIDKFIGDAIMSFRGGPLVSGDLADHAHRAVRSALASSRALAELNDPYFSRVKIGGASADDCLIGAFGTSARLSYTILGDGVNLAARLEPASAQCGTRNLFCEYTQELCANHPDLAWRRWGRIRVAGKSAPVNVYEALDPETEGDLLFVTTFHRALAAFEANDFDRARDLFLLTDSQRVHGDEPSRGYAHWCEKLLLGGPPVGWEPVFETHK